MTRTLTLNGDAISDIPTFYAEINRVFMADEDWAVGQSLDALDDLLYGGYGALEGGEPVVLIWRDMEKNRGDLGLETTRAFYRQKLARPDVFDTARIKRDLAALEAGTGPTYFDIVLQIIAEHPEITLIGD